MSRKATFTGEDIFDFIEIKLEPSRTPNMLDESPSTINGSRNESMEILKASFESFNSDGFRKHE